MIVLFAAALAAEPVGVFVLDEPEKAVQARIDASIEAAIASYPGIFRGLARRKVASTTTWCRRYDFTPTEDSLTWSCDDRPPLTCPRDQLGHTRTLDLDDRRLPVTITWDDPLLAVRFEGDNGHRHNQWTLDDQGRLHLSVRLVSDKLGQPVSFAVRYRPVTPREDAD